MAEMLRETQIPSALGLSSDAMADRSTDVCKPLSIHSCWGHDLGSKFFGKEPQAPSFDKEIGEEGRRKPQVMAQNVSFTKQSQMIRCSE